MSTRPVPWGSGSVEIAIRNGIFPGSVGLAQAHPLTKLLAMGDGLPPVLVHPIHSGVGLRALSSQAFYRLGHAHGHGYFSVAGPLLSRVPSYFHTDTIVTGILPSRVIYCCHANFY